VVEYFIRFVVKAIDTNEGTVRLSKYHFSLGTTPFYFVCIKPINSSAHIYYKREMFGRNMTQSFQSVVPTSGSIMGKLRSQSPMTIIGFLVVLVVIGVGLYYFYNSISDKFKPKFKTDPMEAKGPNEAELLYFSTTWCPHCRAAKPVWEEVSQEYSGKTVNGHKLIFTEVDCTEETPNTKALMDRYKVEGYPTIKLLKDGQVTEFDAKVTKENLDQFIKTAI